MDPRGKYNSPVKERSESASPRAHNDGPSPFVERLGSSAAALTREALLQPSGPTIAQSLGALSIETEKGESSAMSAGSVDPDSSMGASTSRSSSATGVSKESLSSFENAGFRESASSSKGGLPPTAPFDLDAFLSGEDLPAFGSSPSLALDDEISMRKSLETNLHPRGEYYASTDPITSHPSDRSALFTQPVFHKSVASALGGSTGGLVDAEDGVAVVELLSKSGLPADDDLSDQTLVLEGYVTNAQHSEPSKYVQDALEPQSESLKQQWQLIPNFSMTESDLKAIARAMPRAEDVEQNAQVRPWLDILNSYQDEVWGDMLPLVNEAREELAAAADRGDALYDKPAVRRLKMVLNHLQPLHSP